MTIKWNESGINLRSENGGHKGCMKWMRKKQKSQMKKKVLKEQFKKKKNKTKQTNKQKK